MPSAGSWLKMPFASGIAASIDRQKGRKEGSQNNGSRRRSRTGFCFARRGRQHRETLQILSGGFTVIYFYPKDDTSGCTKEALDFSALKPEFDKLGAEVFGISPDAAKSHAKFRAKHALDVTLLAGRAESCHRGVRRLGAEEDVRQGLYGRRTFDLSDRPGREYRQVLARRQSSGHAADVLDALKKRQ